MPRYGYGYAQSPDDMATGNPFYNPNRPGPDWAAGVAAFYQNLQQAKDRKRAQQQQDEELRWQRYAQEQAMKENAWKEQERALALHDKAQKDAEARGKRIQEKMAAFEESSPLPKLRQAQVAKFHGYEPTEFSALPGKRQRELENEMVNQTGRINEVSTRKAGATADRNAAWKDEATQIGKLIDDKINDVDKELSSYYEARKKSEAESKKYGSMGNKLAAGMASAAKQSLVDANRAIMALEQHKKALASHRTKISADKPVDDLTKAAIVSEYTKSINDVLSGGRNAPMVSGQGPLVPEVPDEGDERTIRRNGVIIRQIYQGGNWVDIKG